MKYKFLKIIKSKKSGKKYTAIFINIKTKREKKIHFGDSNYEDYVSHKDEKRKKLYIARHKKLEDWNNPLTAGYWSRWFLWNTTSYKRNFDYIKSDLKKKKYL